jgi:hypothetical protein
MTRMARVAVAGIGLVLSLASCDILFMGVFPASLGQETARADLSSKIGEADAATFNLSIARAYGFEFLILYSTDGFDGTKPHLIVMSPALAVLNTYTLNDIPFFAGNSVFAHLFDGHVAIGNFDGLATSAGLKLVGQLPSSATLSNWSIIGGRSPTMNAYTWSGFQVDQSNLMTYNAYLEAWTPGVPASLARVVRPIDRSHAQLRLVGVYTNPEDELGNESLFVFGESGGGTDYFVQIPKSPDLETAPATPIFASGYPTFSKDNLDSGTIAVTEDSIVAFDGSARSWIRFTPSDPDTVTSLYVGRRGSNERSAFSFSGGYYCIWDPQTRILTRYEDWW